MLLRHTHDGVIAITQPRHAWLSGELAHAWGGGGFFVPEPHATLVCAAALHDIGWLDWERAPRLDEGTGLPLTFDKVEATVHTKLWETGVEAAATYGLLPALHVSRHGVAIYDRTFDAATARPRQIEAVEDFVGRQAIFQAEVVVRLALDPQLAGWLSAEHLDAARAFILAVDTMSLHLCWGVEQVVTVQNVPCFEGHTDITLSKSTNGEIQVDPWPFAQDRLTLIVEGKRIEPVQCQEDLDQVMRKAAAHVLQITLMPGGA